MRRGRPAVAPLRLALAVGLASLCGCPKGDPGLSRDGGPRDAGRDATIHRDAGRDTGTAPDAGATEWIALPGLSERCGTMAVEPAAVHPPLVFEPCPDRPGCRKLVTDWDANDQSLRVAISDDTGYHDGERGYFVMARPDPTSAVHHRTMIATDSGEIVAVVREPDLDTVGSGCAFMGIVIGEGRYALRVFMPDRSERIFGGELSAPAATLREVARYDPRAWGDGWITHLRVGAELLAFNTTGYRGYRVGWDGGIRRIDREDRAAADVNHPSVVGDAIVFDSVDTRNRILVSDEGRAPLVLVPPPEPEAEPSVHDRTDGRTFAWLTGFVRVAGGGRYRFERVELWASPFAARAEDLAPVGLGIMRHTSIHSGVIGGWGHAAVLDDDPAVIRFFRVADGHETELRAPAGLTWKGFVGFIGPREVMVAAGDLGAYSGHSAVMLIDHTAFEPPL